jgi:hypothetical protein
MRETLKQLYRRLLNEYKPAYMKQLQKFRASTDFAQLTAAVAAKVDIMTATVSSPRCGKQRATKQITSDLVCLYHHAAAAFSAFQAYVRSVGDSVGAKVVLPDGLKQPFRVIEKTTLIESANERGNAERIMDVVRGTLVCDSVSQMLQTFQLICEDAAGSEFVVVRVKDRFSNPTDAGWGDIMVNGFLRSDPNRHRCEIQVCK